MQLNITTCIQRRNQPPSSETSLANADKVRLELLSASKLQQKKHDSEEIGLAYMATSGVDYESSSPGYPEPWPEVP